MDVRTLFSKVIILIYRTRQIDLQDNDDLIKTILGLINTNDNTYNFAGNNTTKNLKEFCYQLLEYKEPIPKEFVLEHLGVILENDNKLFTTIKDNLEPDYDDANNKRVITAIVKYLNNFYKEHQAIELVSKMSYDLKFNRNKINNFSEYLKNMIAQLEPLTNTTSTLKDPALVNEVDFENLEEISTVFEEVKGQNNNKFIYKTGWQALNRMTQGGIRRGEFVTVGALQHKYKTGFTLSLFMQIATNNIPVMYEDEKDKKPLLLRISFEDSLTNNMQFMYQYLKAHDGVIIKKNDFEHIETEEMSKYIVSKLTKNGFHIKMMRVDPSQWTYSNVMNKVMELEANGYSIHVLMLDYVTLLPTTGCIQGPMGSDKKDLIRRIRNFCAGRRITFITPLQLSSEAKMLLRHGVPDVDFLNVISDKDYYDGCKTLSQDIDLELYIHLFTHKRQNYLAVRRGKHRIPTVIDNDDKFFLLKFPGLNIPILEDLDKEDSSLKKLPSSSSSEGKNLLDELL